MHASRELTIFFCILIIVKYMIHVLGLHKAYTCSYVINYCAFFLCFRAAIKSVQSKEERKRQLEEQAALEREYALFREKELERERIQMKEREEHRIELDRIICDRRERAMREEERNKAEDEERRIFAEAKKVCRLLKIRFENNDSFILNDRT